MLHFKKYVEIDKINFKNLSKKNQKTECDIMDLNKKILIISMLVMLVCCVSAVSATDIDSTDDVSDDIVVDEVTDVVEDVEIDDVNDDVVEENDMNDNYVEQENLRTTTGTINGNSYTQYFDENGNLNDTSAYQLIFNGYFDEVDSTFGNFKINQYVTLDISNATFHNIGFDLNATALTLKNGNFTTDASATNGATIRVLAESVVVENNTIDVVVPENAEYYAIDVEDASSVRLLDNIITYNCGYINDGKYNYVIKAKNSGSLNIISNNITATLPLRTPNWSYWMSIDADYVAGIAIEKCNNTQFLNNNLIVTANLTDNGSPTLDALIIADSAWVHVENNIINEKDIVTESGNYSYIYGVDVYSCEGINIKNNEITMNGNKSGGHIEGNGTGAAYCIQLSGEYDSADICYNNLTTCNEGPNLAIYAQNYAELYSCIFIYNNNISVTGKAGDDPWSLVSGIESQMKYSYIYDNIIHVNNTAGYVQDNYAFGISYAQWLNGTHYFYINNNTVDVINGDYAVYLIDDLQNVTGSITKNHLIAYTATGNNTGDNATCTGTNIYKANNS